MNIYSFHLCGSYFNRLLVLFFLGLCSWQVKAVDIEYLSESTPYTWIDTSGGTLHSGVTDTGCPSSCTETIPIGFDFVFYGSVKSQVKLSVYGYMTFDVDTVGVSSANSAMPDEAGSNSLVAPFWDTLSNSSGGNVYSLLEGVAPDRRLTITWQDVTHANSSNPVSFQVTLYEGSNDIVYRYQDIDFGDVALNGGASATIGMENDFGTLATQYAYNTASVQNNNAIRFYPVTASVQRPNYQIENIAYDWVDTSAGPQYYPSASFSKQTVPIGFNFAFYNEWYSEMVLTLSGFASFTPEAELVTLGVTNQRLPDPVKPNHLLAVLWDSYVPGLDGLGHIETLLDGVAPNRRFTITWRNVCLFDNSNNSATFQVSLYEGTNDIVMRYQDVFFGSGIYTYANYGRDATVGVEDRHGELGTLHSYRQQVIGDNTALRFSIDQTNLPPAPAEPPAEYLVETVTSDWIDPSTGVQLFNCDDCSVGTTIGFDFNFYGTDYNTVNVVSNGMLRFDASWPIVSVNGPLPASTVPNNLIAPHWDDLDSSTAGAIYAQLDGVAPNRRFTVSWVDVSYPGSPDPTNGISFQVTLYEGSNEIVFRYLDVVFPTTENSYGASATVGIENSDGSEGVLYSYQAANLSNGLALRYYRNPELPPLPPPPVPVTYAVESISSGWIDASPGTSYSLCVDCAVLADIGFSFDFYGKSFSSLYIGSNGLMSFDSSGTTTYFNSAIPSSQAPNNLIAPYWDDLNPGAGGFVYSYLEGDAPNRRFTVSWVDVPRYYSIGGASFQATLYEGSNEIVFRYLDVEFGYSFYDYGASATVGIENGNGSVATQYLYNNAILTNGMALRFYKN